MWRKSRKTDIKFQLEMKVRWLAMAKNLKKTSKTVASKASKVLRDSRYSKTSKSIAGSALVQTKKSGR